MRNRKKVRKLIKIKSNLNSKTFKIYLANIKIQ